MHTPFSRDVQVLLLNRRINFRGFEFLLCLWRARHRRAQEASLTSIFSFSGFLHRSSTQSTFQKVSTFPLKVGQYCPTYPPDNRCRHLLKMPQQGSIFSYNSPGSSLGKSMTGKLVYNFPVMSMNFTSSSIRVPNNNDNYTATLTRITEHKRCSILAIWKGRTIEIRGPQCA